LIAVPVGVAGSIKKTAEMLGIPGVPIESSGVVVVKEKGCFGKLFGFHHFLFSITLAIILIPFDHQ
jgi:hypothetical protein